MRDVCSLIWLAMIELFRSRASRQAEILTLRHQLNVLRRKSPRRLGFTSIDRLVFAGLYRLAPGVLHRWPFATNRHFSDVCLFQISFCFGGIADIRRGRHSITTDQRKAVRSANAD
jgi:hypothetical protein